MQFIIIKLLQFDIEAKRLWQTVEEQMYTCVRVYVCMSVCVEYVCRGMIMVYLYVYICLLTNVYRGVYVLLYCVIIVCLYIYIYIVHEQRCVRFIIVSCIRDVCWCYWVGVLSSAEHWSNGTFV